jgi:lipopolysaccharide/colanic/teichoic acid biosynthesis glycosyltransferase
MRLLGGRDSTLSGFSKALYKDFAQDRHRTPTGKRDCGLWLLYSFFSKYDTWEQFGASPRSKTNHISGISSRCYRFTKRSGDIVGSSILLIGLLPLCLMIAVLIKLDTPGPVLFRHHRIGRNGKHFVLWKFRSMRKDVPRYGISPRNVEDMRLTRVGRLIRRLSIDELPQLINVLRGEMSFVGPRPEMPFIVDRYRPFERERLAAKPGITGLWQVSPARALPIHDNLQYDLHYISNQNLLLDCAIILRTIAAVIRGIGAV